MTKNLIAQLFLFIILFSCSSSLTEEPTNAVFEVYGGEVLSEIELKLDTEEGRTKTHHVTLNWSGEFPDQMMESSLLNIANLYYQNLNDEEKLALDYVISRIEDSDSFRQLKAEKWLLREMGELYPISMQMFKAIQTLDSANFYKIVPSEDRDAHSKFFNVIKEIKRTEGEITDVFYKGCSTDQNFVVVTHIYYTKGGAIYNGHFKIDRNTHNVNHIEFTKTVKENNL